MHACVVIRLMQKKKDQAEPQGLRAFTFRSFVARPACLGQVAAAQAPYDAAVSRLQSAQALERVCVQAHLKKKEAADNLESRLAALVVRKGGGAGRNGCVVLRALCRVCVSTGRCGSTY